MKNNKRHTTPQSLNSAVKSICDIMRCSNCAGALPVCAGTDLDSLLRILDEREQHEAETAEAVGAEFTPSLESPYRWRDWAAPGGSQTPATETGGSRSSVTKKPDGGDVVPPNIATRGSTSSMTELGESPTAGDSSYPMTQKPGGARCFVTQSNQPDRGDAVPPGWKRAELERGALSAFFGFVNGELIPHLKSLKDRPNATPRQKVISEIFSGVECTRIDTERNFLDVLDKVNEISAESVDPTHVFRLSQVYEGLLLKMGEKGNDGGQFFTPREVIRAMVRVIDPRIGETVYDPGCGTGRFPAQSYEQTAGPNNEKNHLARPTGNAEAKNLLWPRKGQCYLSHRSCQPDAARH